MNAGAKLLHSTVLVGLLAAFLATEGTARAACVNDIDCPDTACGGQVCSYAGATPTCVPAGTGQKGMDGWCTAANGDNDCKCKALGAKCETVYCTFTKPSDAPASGAGGTTGSAGSSAGGSTGTAGSGTDGGTKPASSSSGCSVASSTSGSLGALVGLALVAGRLVRRRRRA